MLLPDLTSSPLQVLRRVLLLPTATDFTFIPLQVLMLLLAVVLPFLLLLLN
jgi:hypothetical protein